MDNAPNKSKLQALLAECNSLCDMSYIYDMHTLNNCLFKPDNSHIGFIKIYKFPESDSWHSFCYILNSLCTLGATMGYILTIEDDDPIIYIGISSNLYLNECLDILYNGLINMFYNINPSILTREQCDTLLSKIFSPNIKAVSSVSTIPGDSSQPILNNFIDMMGCKNEFYLLLLATPCSYNNITNLMSSLRDLSSNLTSLSIENRSFVNTITKSSSAGSSNSFTSTNGHSNASTQSYGSAINYAEYTNITPSTSLPICDKNNLNLSLLSNKGRGNNNNCSNSCTNGCSDSDSNTKGCNDQSSTNRTETTKLSFITENKNIISSIDRINLVINRLQTLTSYSSFHFCAYVLSPKVFSTAMASNIYLGCSNPAAHILPVHTNMWTSESTAFEYMMTSLKQFKHPNFTLNSYYKYASTMEVSPTHVVSSYELMNSLYFI